MGRCQKAFECDRLHICEKYLSRDCHCIKTHDFYADQPLKSLQDKGVPDTFVPSLREIYANKEALRFFNNKSDRSSAPADSDARSDGLNSNQAQGYRGRGRGGNRGFRGSKGSRGNAGKPAQQHRTSSLSDIVSSFEFVSLNGDVGQKSELDSSNDDLSSAGDSAWSSEQRLWYRGGGRGGNRGNRGRRGSAENPRRIPSLLDDLGQFCADWLNKNGEELSSTSSNVFTAGDDSDTAGGDTGRGGGRQDRNKKQPSAVRGRGRGGARGNRQRAPRNQSTDNSAAAGGRDEPSRKQRGTNRFKYSSGLNVL